MFPKATLLLSASTYVALAASLPKAEPQQAGGLANGFTISTSFTQYGGCNTNTVACGSFEQRFQAAISENLYGQSNGFSQQACGTCWALTPTHDMNGQPLSGGHSITVKVNNLCPAQDNEKCSQPGLQGTNSLGMNAHFDLCADDGAAGALFGSSGTQLASGTATKVAC
ncbi:MAG: hypothetical protein L6R39_000713 [Caloplaca ligustica]|nr:MAG: hypothetical protein L6R39_000713 [Caloplaca ligustica]